MLCQVNVWPLSIYITNDTADMVSARKICARLSFDPDDAAIYKDTLCLSVDAPELELKGWRTPAQAPVLYVANFKKNKRLFTESFNLEILIDFDEKDRKKQLKVLGESYLSISSLLLTKDGKNKAENVIVPLKTSEPLEDFSLTMTTTSLGLLSHYTSTLLPYQRSFDVFAATKHFIYKNNANEILVIDRTKDLWSVMRQQFGKIVDSFSFYKWYSVLWIILLLLLLRLFYPVFRFIVPLSSLWYREVVLLICILLFVSSWWLLRAFVAPSLWYGVLAVLCVPGGCYYLWGGTETFLDRLKVLLGIVFAVSLLPLLVLACMHNNFAFFIRCLK